MREPIRLRFLIRRKMPEVVGDLQVPHALLDEGQLPVPCFWTLTTVQADHYDSSASQENALQGQKGAQRCFVPRSD